MKKDLVSTKEEYQKSGKVSLFEAGAGLRLRRQRSIPSEKLSEITAKIRAKLDEGLSSAAEKIITETLSNYSHTPDSEAKLLRLLSYAFETQGNYKESLSVVEKYNDEENIAHLELETAVSVLTQLAIAYNNTNDYPRAVGLLNNILEVAKEENLNECLGEIYIALSRVYRKLNEFPISRDHAEKALNYYREQGAWRGMAEAYHMIAMACHQEGGSEKAIEYFEQAVKIIGSHSAPFLLGKIYSDMSGAYWFMRHPQDGIACLEKSIKFFEQTEYKIQAAAAYNNLGLHLVMRGEWSRAEAAYNRALDLATKANHVHVAGILDSLGELKILHGEFAEAQLLLEKSVALAEERKNEWYAIQSLRNLSRSLLAQGKLREAKEKARETIQICHRIGERQIANMARLVLAEVCLEENNFAEAERELAAIEDAAEPSSDFFVLGNIQRIRGLIASKQGDEELAVYHFNRSLTIFETAEDLYHTALAHYLIGKYSAETQPDRAAKHLVSAGEIFRRLGVAPLFKETEKILETVKTVGTIKKRVNSASSQLFMLRLAEATASRELLFRELVAILQQESRAQKIIVAETDGKNGFYPFITHGYVPNESAELVAKLQNAHQKNDLENFAKTKNLQIFHLRAPSSTPAFLVISPRVGAVLNDDSSLQPLLRVVELGMDVCALRDKDKSQHVEHESSPFTSNSLMPGFIHSSPAMTSLVEEVYKIRSSDVTVLVTGESGTGKELVSRAIHSISNRKDKIFIPFNCTAVPKELAEGHLFGYRKGAFTGAVTDSPGMIRAADGGTLFLDEIGDLPIDVQPKLLRFLQEGEVQPIGEKRPIKVDVRVIAATNMPLEEKVADGTFREDLYYRLNVIRLRVPPLRERRSEIPPMINYYINQYSARFGKRDITITPQTIDLLMVCDWDGNVRQLCNEIQRAVARAVDGENITPDHLSPELKRTARPISFAETGNVKPIASYNSAFTSLNVGSSSGTLEEAVSELEIQMIKNALSRHNWNISRVAAELGLTRRGVYLKLGRYGIEKSA
ncbi:MAG: sigma 54-interacting transcriptional regulator [Acidobacteriota bacterium]|nr:sigma 54-interacting transcriptional regulator [Acidobacteriota bacterium]